MTSSISALLCERKTETHVISPDIDCCLLDTFDVLEKRLIDRKKNEPSEIKERIRKAKIEMKTEADFDTVIINKDLDVAKQELIDKVEKFLK